jgi:transposase
MIIGDGEMRKRYILCFIPKEVERQRIQCAKVIEILEKELARHPNKTASAQRAIDLLASKRYKRYLTISKSNNIRIDRAKVHEAKKYDGKWVLQTNDDTISIQDAASGYKGLMVIERCFRSLKRTQIKMTPMFHWVPRRIETHVRFCVMALLIERVVEIACR